MHKNSSRLITDWPPLSHKEMIKRGWDQLDVILITGDAYVDHPAFGVSVIGRLLEFLDFKVGIIARPNWRDDLRDFKKLGKPKYFFGITAGNMDSMVNKYTANKRLRSIDAYSPGGDPHFRPDYATVAYTKIVKQLYPDAPVILGGIEASLRRVTHYDYWQDKLMPNILTLSTADLLVYGMGEKPMMEIAKLLRKGVPFSSLKTVPQTAFLLDADRAWPKNKNWETKYLNTHEECLVDKKKYLQNFISIETESNTRNAGRLIQTIGQQNLVINPPYELMTEEEIDSSFELPYTRLPHPRYARKGPIAAYEMIKNSINIHRGCFGGCAFCTISAHQGKAIISRSEKSILKELEYITSMEEFDGTITDLGGPSANMFKMQGLDQALCAKCTSPSCIFPRICKNLETNPSPLISLYRKVLHHPKVKHVFVNSGVRYDLLLDESSDYKNENDEYLKQLIEHHVSGRLKVAPEHTEDHVLELMRKPSFDFFIMFKKIFEAISAKKKINQEIIPYFMSAHPACSEKDMLKLAIKTKRLGYRLEQVQSFTPTPMTLASEIYYSGINPYTMEKIYSASTAEDKSLQNILFFWYKRENRRTIGDFLTSRKMNKCYRELID